MSIIGEVGATLMSMLRDFLSLPAELVAFTVKLNVPVVVGVPKISPDELKYNPFGRLSISSDQVIGAVPLALRM
jgi:hypothetical protein